MQRIFIVLEEPRPIGKGVSVTETFRHEEERLCRARSLLVSQAEAAPDLFFCVRSAVQHGHGGSVV